VTDPHIDLPEIKKAVHSNLALSYLTSVPRFKKKLLKI
jgi:hypothetical protein